MSEVLKLNIKAKKLRAIIPDETGDSTGNSSYDSFYEENSIKKELESRFRSGYDTGYKTAQDEMEKSFSAQLMEQSGQFYNILSTFEEKFKQYENNFDKIVIEVSKQICKKILTKELENVSIIEKSLADASTKVLGANEVKIKLHPEDLEKIKSMETQTAIQANFTKINFEPDASIEKGGCLIDSEIGNVDARISSQLNEIIKALENNLIDDQL